MDFRITQDEQLIADWCRLALNERVYHRLGQLKWWYRHTLGIVVAVEPDPGYPDQGDALINLMATAWDGDKLVGVSVMIQEWIFPCWTNRPINFGVYVLELYRERGIGTELYRLIESQATEKILYDANEHNKDFFLKVA